MTLKLGSLLVTELKEKLLNFIDKANTILEKNIEEFPFTEKNLIDAITKEKDLTTVIEDMRNNKENWIVTNVERYCQQPADEKC